MEREGYTVTDNEIIKALWCCAQEGEKCRDCPYDGECERGQNLMILALDIIHRQKEEIENKNRQVWKLISLIGK